MPHHAPAHALALLAASLALTGPDRAAAATITFLQETAQGGFTSSEVGQEEFDRFYRSLDNDWFASRSLLEVDIDGRTTFVTVNNTPDDRYWINRSFDFVSCDGSVRIACDGSVIPAEAIALTLAVTKNPSISMGWTLTGSNPQRSVIAASVIAGLNPFAPDALLIGSFEAAMSLELQGPTLQAPDPEFEIRRDGELSFFAGRLGFDADLTPVTVIGTATDGFGDPVDPGGPLAIPAGTPGTPETFTRLTPCQLFCDQKAVRFALDAPGVPNQYLPDGKRVVAGSVTFSFDLAPPPPPIPLPAAGWLLLGGLGALALCARRRPA